jgi:hypothetical protein
MAPSAPWLAARCPSGGDLNEPATRTTLSQLAELGLTNKGERNVNLCRACGHDFSSVTLFDAHRVGKHEYLFDSERLDGRRCLDASEMESKGWAQNGRGRWNDPVRSEQVRRAFAEAL